MEQQGIRRRALHFWKRKSGSIYIKLRIGYIAFFGVRTQRGHEWLETAPTLHIGRAASIASNLFFSLRNTEETYKYFFFTERLQGLR